MIITGLSKKEHEVLMLVVSGKTNKDIMQELDIQEVTVKKHITSLFRKLYVMTRVELIRYYTKLEQDYIIDLYSLG